MDWLGEEIRTLRALIDRIIPRDDFPAASGNGVDVYVLRLLEHDLADHANEFRQGLALLNVEANARFNLPFPELGEDLQDELLSRIENREHKLGPFFDLMISLTNEGYYTDLAMGLILTAYRGK